MRLEIIGNCWKLLEQIGNKWNKLEIMETIGTNWKLWKRLEGMVATRIRRAPKVARCFAPNRLGELFHFAAMHMFVLAQP